jgi:hypothetical protein
VQKKKDALILWRGPESILVYHLNSKILNLGRTFKSYLRLFGERSPNVTICCCACNRIMHKHGRFFRSVSSKRITVQIPIYRWYCLDCKITTSVLPDFLVPYARHVTHIREVVIRRKLKDWTWHRIMTGVFESRTRISLRTMKRWWHVFLLKSSSVSLQLAEWITRRGDSSDLLRLFPNRLDARKQDTAKWLLVLLEHWFGVPPILRGVWSIWNTKNHICTML